jgi:hypothetical protein
MEADEQAICSYLKSFPKEFVSAREICRRAGGKKRYRDDPYWAKQILMSLAEKGILESDSAGHYRLRPPDKKKGPKRWIAPHIQELLRKSGKDFEGVIEFDDTDDPSAM